MSEDFYTLLGVGPDASEETIRRAFRERVSEYHPDVSDDEDAGETIQQLNRAKDVLTDEERRREYDSLGHERFLERTTGDGRTASSSANQSVREGGPIGLALGAFGRGFSGGLATDQGGIDLRAFVRPSESERDPRGGTGHDPPSAEPGKECPRCGGHGRFVHELDTVLGRRQRIELCEQCGGDGTFSR